VLDDVHGGAGQQCMELMHRIDREAGDAAPTAQHVAAGLDAYIAENGKIIPGFGHRFHGVDPRAVRLMALVRDARAQGVVTGRFGAIGELIDQVLTQRKGAPIPMNIDGATAAIYCELGFAPELGRGLFILSRSVGILAHAWEQKQQGGRIKGPMPPSIPYTYTGPATRKLDR
jgi:citrate synthase